MKGMEVMRKLSGAVHRAGFGLQKHSPEILVVAGVVGTVASAVLACRATTKLSGILDKSKEDIETIHNAVGDEALKEEYTPEDAKKDLAIVYIQTGVKLVRLYAPAVALGALSLTGILASHRLLRKRNLALAAAYTSMNQSLRVYRTRVMERFGEQAEKELWRGVKAVEIQKTVTDADGKEKTVKETVDAVDEIDGHPAMSAYGRWFEDSSNRRRDHAYNMAFLKAEQQYANDLLKANGYLFLNDVYDRLGFPRTKDGQCVGWVYDAKNPVGDNYVDFGILEVYAPDPEEEELVYDNSILLDFNVDGNILDRFI